MTTSSCSEERMQTWFDLASKESFDDEHWEIAAQLPEATLSHRSSTHGGHLIKFHMKNLFIQGAPEKSCDLLLRPEVRCQYDDGQNDLKLRWRQTLAPGDTLVERSSSLWVLRSASLLFGNASGRYKNSFFYDTMPMSARHQLRRDFPREGDCAYACFQDYEGIGQEGIMVCRNLGPRERFSASLIFSTPEDKWPSWASPLFGFLTDQVHKAMASFLNRPGLQELRRIDEEFYLVLCMRSFNRGPPLVPQPDDNQDLCITISAGEELGLTKWVRFYGTSTSGRFRMVEYMRSFLAALGHDIQIYSSLEGRALVPYQCVVARSQWMPIRASFAKAFLLQKAAYRRANGGTTAPSIVEDVRPHLLGEDVSPSMETGGLPATKFIVRNTFLEVDDGSSPEGCLLRRSKSDCDMETFSV